MRCYTDVTLANPRQTFDTFCFKQTSQQASPLKQYCSEKSILVKQING